MRASGGLSPDEGPLQDVANRSSPSGARRPSPGLTAFLKRNHEILAGYLHVIRIAANRMLRGAAQNDFTHSEEVSRRLDHLVPDPTEMQLTVTEAFILLSGAYLHDLGKSIKAPAKDHGARSAHIIENCRTFSLLAPNAEILHELARVCDAHDGFPDKVGSLEEHVELHVRYDPLVQLPGVSVRTRMLAGLLVLADELEGTCDRTQWSQGSDPRNSVSSVVVEAEDRTITIKFKHGTPLRKRLAVRAHYRAVIQTVRPFLPHTFSFGLVAEGVPPVADATPEPTVAASRAGAPEGRTLDDEPLYVEGSIPLTDLIELQAEIERSRDEALGKALKEHQEGDPT